MTLHSEKLAARPTCGPQSASPLYGIGDVVRYVDHHTRSQEGEVLWIEATWRSLKRPPLIVYTLRHPSYAGRRMYAAEDKIAARSAPAPAPPGRDATPRPIPAEEAGS